MTDEQPAAPPQRVRVTAPRNGPPAASAPARTGPIRRPTPGAAGVAPHAPTSDIQGVYVRSLIRSQLRIGLVFAAGFAVATALFAIALALTPALDVWTIAGVPVSWLLLAVGVYPLALTVAAIYVRAASRNEARYRSLSELGDEERP
ncbi:hypothetical protein [Agromyces bauzanensis]|uniref:DUF485 domain-containing protein n=1 Tax=Agromyces bauzanensis TaxID=1308924 RepID=A0A917PK57_9MICO|nr:hypothetical protein [Agromyces bauzanensis]GGJ81866.1 hypothetical protein GCM10011372_20370 [Agromyces bauzanensis]